ncbi:hypothetical protein HYH03_015264 [Edaphochlamys debaryana]|uniref:Uncharacterized protein n=1 Tax=Edaphochlamys debaryana TaxID=47281 RepID=A0A836BSR5_9CHLO|nr:hypothetical protein HYH03_015264 [Edaphochlamys debaryana]|eukprot:KAG2486058.1 hypothetical protein HYH03_015264 [Edaphochlamys debaryana]
MAAAALLPRPLLGRLAAARPGPSPRPSPAACRVPALPSAPLTLAAAPADGRRTTAAAASKGGGGGPRKRGEPTEAPDEPWIAVAGLVALVGGFFLLWLYVVAPNWATWERNVSLGNVSLVDVVAVGSTAIGAVAAAWGSMRRAFRWIIRFRSDVRAAVEVKEAMAKAEERQGQALVEVKETMAKAEERQGQALVEVKETMAKAEERQGQALVEVKETMAKAEERQGQALVEVKETMAKAEERQGQALAEVKETMAKAETLAQVERKLTESINKQETQNSLLQTQNSRLAIALGLRNAGSSAHLPAVHPGRRHQHRQPPVSELGSSRRGGDGGVSGSSQHQEYANVASAIALTIVASIPLPASRHALGVLRFARALLATQPFHALARRLAEAAATLSAPRRAPLQGSGGGAGSSGAEPSGAAGGVANRTGLSSSAPSFAAASWGPSGGARPSGAASSAAAAYTGSIDTNLVLPCFCTQFTGFKVAALDYDGQLQRGPNGHGAGVPVMAPGLAAEVAAERPATLLSPPMAYVVLVKALECARQLLSTSGPSSPRQAEQRREWWWLAGWAVGSTSLFADQDLRRWLWGLVTEPLLAVWPDGRLDLDALPPAAPPEVTAALAGGLLPQLSHFISPARADATTSLGLGTATATDLFAACCEGRDSGAQGANGFTLFLAPLLAYGGVERSQELLESLGQLAGLGPPSPAPSTGRNRDAAKAAAARQAAALLRDLGRALRGRGGTGQGAAGPSTSAAAPESPVQRLERMAAHASGLWGLPLGA